MSRKRLKANSRANPDGILGKYPKIPTRIEGNSEFAVQQGAGIGKKLLHDLSMQIGYNNIQAGAAAEKRHEFSDGSWIDIKINYGLSRITVYIPEPKNEKPPVTLESAGFKCFIFATIENVTCSNPEPDPPECNFGSMDLAGDRYLYEISFFYVDRYVLLHNYKICSAGWESYTIGQYVLLIPDATSVGDCCANERDLALEVLDPGSIKMRYQYLDVCPVHILNEMFKIY